jgi:ankyrin repeat protein
VWHISAQDIDFNADVLRAQLDSESERINEKDYIGRTALSVACLCENFRFVQILLEHGADPKLSDRAGQTPLHHACWSGCRECVEKLVQKGAELRAQDAFGCTPLFYALRHSGGLVDYLLEQHVEVKHQDYIGRTVLHCAAALASLDVIQRLLDHHPTFVNCKDYDGRIPLHCAITHDSVEASALLLDRTDMRYAIDNRGWTILHFAACYATIPLLQKLAEILLHRPDPSARDADGHTADNIFGSSIRDVIRLSNGANSEQEAASWRKLIQRQYGLSDVAGSDLVFEFVRSGIGEERRSSKRGRSLTEEGSEAFIAIPGS